MTLYRQFLAGSITILFLLCGGLWLGELKRTRDFLSDQLQSHAQDTATYLGLSLSTLTNSQDLPAMEAMIDALFDRGFYQQIVLLDLQGNTLIERHLDATPEAVPPWFTHLITFTPPAGTALIMRGWQQRGSIKVESHPGFAYATLWQAAISTGRWFTLVGLGLIVVGGLLLQKLLRPLVRIEQQAQALYERTFSVQTTLPKTRELRRVVKAMNQLSTRLKAMFEEQSAVADDLQQKSYRDPLTGLGNRRYLERQVQVRVEKRNTATRGSFFLVQVDNLGIINRQQGYTSGDTLLQEIAAIIKQACLPLAETVIARLGGGDFALLLPHIDAQAAEKTLRLILEDIQQLGQGPRPSPDAIAHCGGVFYDHPLPLSQLLQHADKALDSARYTQSLTRVNMVSLDDEAISLNRHEWISLLEYVLTNQTIVLFSQPTVSGKDPKQVMHHEILTRVLTEHNTMLSLGQFVPLAERLGLMPALDRIIVEHILRAPLDMLEPARITINLSPLSLADREFSLWFPRQLEQFAKRGIELCFEFPEFRIRKHPQLLKQFSQDMRKLGHHIGVDHFGQGLIHFGYLQSLLPDYVKIDRAITRGLEEDVQDDSFFINTLCSAAHSLGIKVVAEGIENKEHFKKISPLPVDMIQGFYIQCPARLPGTESLLPPDE